MDLTLEQIVRNRQDFENEVYDLLVNVELLAPPDFWNPVEIKLPDSFTFEKVISEPTECFVCFSDFTEFNKLECCKKKMCEGCTTRWFEKSTKCPFCNQDLRNFTK